MTDYAFTRIKKTLRQLRRDVQNKFQPLRSLVFLENPVTLMHQTLYSKIIHPKFSYWWLIAFNFDIYSNICPFYNHKFTTNSLLQVARSIFFISLKTILLTTNSLFASIDLPELIKYAQKNCPRFFFTATVVHTLLIKVKHLKRQPTQKKWKVYRWHLWKEVLKFFHCCCHG